MKTKNFYLFDCMNGLLGDRLWPEETLPGEDEKGAIRLAANYEAYLYRYTIDIDTEERISTKCLYEPDFL